MIFLRISVLSLLFFSAPGMVGKSSAQDSHTLFGIAEKEFAIGRFWHASQILRDSQESRDQFTPQMVVLLAEADARWANWDGVIQGLEGYSPIPDESFRLQVLLARGYEETGKWALAYEEYADLLDSRVKDEENIGVLMSRTARTAFRAGDLEAAVEISGNLMSIDPVLASWTALKIAEKASEGRNVDLVLRLLPLVWSDRLTASHAWNLEAKSWLIIGDSAQALESYLRISDQTSTPSRGSQIFNAVAGLKLASGDTIGAKQAYLDSFETHPIGSSGAEAAWALFRLGSVDQETSLLYAKALEDAREHHRALIALDRYGLLAPDSIWKSQEIQMSRASLLWKTGRIEESVVLFRKLVEIDDGDFELKVLDQWRQARRSQGNSSAVRTIEGWITERFPKSRQGTDIIASKGHSAFSSSNYQAAKFYYHAIQDMGSSHASAGLARMRLGQIYLEEQNYLQAVDVFRVYLKEFPTGRRWEEAAYWLSRTLVELGRTQEAFEILQQLSKNSALSYYGVLAFDLLEEPYHPEISQETYTTGVTWLEPPLMTLDKLQSAGLERGAEAVVSDLISAVENSVEGSLVLAESLIERGFTIEGINLGWKLLGDGAVMDRRLATVLYPFPYKEIVYSEALEYGADPILLAALIRQESAFTAAIRSPVGAVGLMQVMPATGAEVARGAGLGSFTESSLETPEINLHLGTRYLLEMENRFGEVGLPLVLSAYNAGPTRARRWRSLLRSEDLLRFTERIPFEETRGYVKNVVRNIHIYKFLYESIEPGVNR